MWFLMKYISFILWHQFMTFILKLKALKIIFYIQFYIKAIILSIPECTHTPIFTHTHTHKYICTHIYIKYMHICTYTRIIKNKHTYTHTYKHTHTHTHTHIYIYIYMYKDTSITSCCDIVINRSFIWNFRCTMFYLC